MNARIKKQRRGKWTRRDFLRICATLPAPLILVACSNQPAASVPSEAAPTRTAAPQPSPTGADVAAVDPSPTSPPAANPDPTATQVLEPTPSCADDDDPTPEQTAGPFFLPSSPERRSLLEPGISGTKIVVTGQVLSTACAPLAGALLDFWHADDNGDYDVDGYRLRGHQFTDAQGRYTLESIVPGLYPGRTRHFHVMVQAANQPVLTTQLYFPGEPQNASDGIFHPALVMEVQDRADGKAANFTFVLEA